MQKIPLLQVCLFVYMCVDRDKIKFSTVQSLFV